MSLQIGYEFEKAKSNYVKKKILKATIAEVPHLIKLMEYEAWAVSKITNPRHPRNHDYVKNDSDYVAILKELNPNEHKQLVNWQKKLPEIKKNTAAEQKRKEEEIQKELLNYLKRVKKKIRNE